MGTVHHIDTTAFAALSRALEREGKHGITAAIQRAIDKLNLELNDQSDGIATMQFFHVKQGDDIVELEHVDMGYGAHSFSLRRYRLADQKDFDFGAMLSAL